MERIIEDNPLLGGTTQGLPGMTGERTENLPRLIGGNNGLEGIEGGNSGNNEINNNSTKNNYPRGGWDLENIKPLIERDSDVYRPIYEKETTVEEFAIYAEEQSQELYTDQ